MSFCDFNHLIETKSQDGWVWRSSTFFCVAGKEKKKRVSYSDKQKEKNRLNLLRVFIWQTKGWILSWWWRCHHHCRCHRSNCRCRCHCRHRRRCRSRSCSHCRRMQFVCAQPWKMTPHILTRSLVGNCDLPEWNRPPTKLLFCLKKYDLGFWVDWLARWLLQLPPIQKLAGLNPAPKLGSHSRWTC